MRQSQDLLVYESCEEWIEQEKGFLRTSRMRGEKHKICECICTFDIETTNTQDDGFAYSFALNIDGKNIVLRYIEDVIKLLEHLAERHNLSKSKRLIIYVHNLGYEYWYLTQIFTSVWGTPDVLLTAPKKPLTMRFKNGLEFRDSLKLFQKSLAGATKGCKHTKLVGDLDYTKYRTPDTELTQEEFDYIVNDVQGLYEAILRLKEQHGFDMAHMPLTNTRLVVGEMKKAVRGDKEVTKAKKELALTKDQIKLAYNTLAGGDTHGCRWKAGTIFKNCNSADFKSAHPSQQLRKPFPWGEPITFTEPKTEEEAKLLIESDYGWVGKVTILQPKCRRDCPDPTISVSKCSVLKGLKSADNGRVLKADAIVAYMDSNDYIRFSQAYEYEMLEVSEGFCFGLRMLPESLRKFIRDKFMIKETAEEGPERAFAKICVNTIFGAMAQKNIRDEYSLRPEEMEVTKENWEGKLERMEEEELIKVQTKGYPFLWGLWTSSLTRLDLFNLLKTCGWEKVIYWDTDSCKYEGEKSKEIEEYNKEVIKTCEEAGATIYKDGKNPVYIGVAEDEYPDIEYGYKEFVFLRAKCYAASAWNKKTKDYQIATTIAGVKKANGAEALRGDLNNLTYGLNIPDAGGQTLHYNYRPIQVRHEWSRPTRTASFIWMTKREYLISMDRVPTLEMEIIAE